MTENPAASALPSVSVDTAGTVSKPSITVGVFCHNHERWVDECLQSVLDVAGIVEVVDISDDASTDGSQGAISELLSKFMSSRPTIRFTPGHENLGFATRLNDFLKRVETDYWCVVSADDRFTPGGLAQLVRQLELHPEADVVFGSYSYIDEYGASLGEASADRRRMAVCERYLAAAPAFSDLLTIGNFVAGGCTVVRRQTPVALFDTTLTNAEDYDYWLSLGPGAKFLFHDEPVWEYRILENSKYRRTGTNRVRSELTIIGKYSSDAPLRVRVRAILQGVHRWKASRLRRFAGTRISLKESASLLRVPRIWFCLLLPVAVCQSASRRVTELLWRSEAPAD